jgi:hypothetical protein
VLASRGGVSGTGITFISGISATSVFVTVIIGTFVLGITWDWFMSTSNTAFTAIISTGIVVIAVYISVVNTKVVIAVEFMIFIVFFNGSVNTSNVTIRGVVSASIIIITINLFVNTSYFRIAGEVVTLVGIVTAFGIILNNTSLAVSFMTFIWRTHL